MVKLWHLPLVGHMLNRSNVELSIFMRVLMMSKSVLPSADLLAHSKQCTCM